MKLPLYIALRYFFSKRSSIGFNASSIISYISLGGFFVGTAALVIILSVFNGFEQMFTDMFSAYDPDLKIKPAIGKYFYIDTFPVNFIKNNNNISAFSFTAEENALLHYSNKQTIASIKGVDENFLKTIQLNDEHIINGELLLNSGDTFFALVGSELAYQLGIDPYDQFNILGIYVPKAGKVDFLNPENSFSKVYVNPSGIFSIQDEVDAKNILVHLKLFSKLLDKENKAGAIEIKLTNSKHYQSVQKELQQQLGENYLVLNRYQMHETFYKVMKSEKAISFIILVFILFVAAFNAIGSLYMLVIEKKNDLHTLYALGLEPKKASQIYLLQGILVAIFGGIAGMILGIAVCLIQQEFGIITLHNSGDFFMSAYPVKLVLSDLVYVFITILILGIFTSLYPAYKAKTIFNFANHN